MAALEWRRGRPRSPVAGGKGGLPNLLLAFPSFDPTLLEPWVELERDGISAAELAARALELSNNRALSNACLWCLGRLQTDADRARVIDGLAGAHGTEQVSADELADTLRRLAPRWFVVRNAHVSSSPVLLQPRYAMSLMRGPMTRGEIRAARGVAAVGAGNASASMPSAAETFTVRT